MESGRLHVVRLYDSYENRWFDETKPLSWEEAKKVWDEKTGNGTHNTKYADGQYYDIFPADTRMMFR